MNDRDGLLEACLEDPSNETARLALADLLDDNGIENRLRQKGYWLALMNLDNKDKRDVFYISLGDDGEHREFVGTSDATLRCYACDKLSNLVSRGGLFVCHDFCEKRIVRSARMIGCHNITHRDCVVERCSHCFKCFRHESGFSRRLLCDPCMKTMGRTPEFSFFRPEALEEADRIRDEPPIPLSELGYRPVIEPILFGEEIMLGETGFGGLYTGSIGIGLAQRNIEEGELIAISNEILRRGTTNIDDMIEQHR